MISKHNLIYSLLDIKGVGTVQANKILLTIGDRFKMSDSFLIQNAIESQLTTEQRQNFKVKEDSIGGKNTYPVNFVSIIDSDYPQELKKYLSKNAPPILSFIGNYDIINQHKVGFCGSRKASGKGLEVAADIVSQLVEKGLAIISGYASGIDIQTHYHALKNGGTTIIIMPEGISYFRIKKELKDVWDWERVLVISEFQPNAIWSTGRAMQRNNTIIALSDIMVLIEAGETGGSMDAGKKTLLMNKYLFAPIYGGMPESAIGNQILIEKGAFPLKKSATTMRANLKKIFELLAVENEYNLF